MTGKIEKIFKSKFLLRFNDERYNEEYAILSHTNIKKMNLILSFSLLFFSLLFLIWILVIYSSSQRQFSDMKIYYTDISLTNLDRQNMGDIVLFYDKIVFKYKNTPQDTILTSIGNIVTRVNFLLANDNFKNNNGGHKIKNNLYQRQSNFSNYKNLSYNVNHNIYEFNSNLKDLNSNASNIFSHLSRFDDSNINDNRYLEELEILKNNTLINSNYNYDDYVKFGDEIANNLPLLKDYLRKILFSKYCLLITTFYALINVLSFIVTIIIKKIRILKLNFLLMSVFIGMNFHILSGIFRSYYSMETETLFLVISFQLFIQIIISLKTMMSWTIILISSLIKTTLEMTLWYFIHFKYNQIILFYFIVCAVGSMLSTIISYHKELTSKTEFYWNSKTKYKDYLFNLLYNIDQGFLGFKNNKIVFMNRFMQKILKNTEIEITHDEINTSKSFYTDILNNKNYQAKRNNIRSNPPISDQATDDSKIYLNQAIKQNKLNILLENLLENFTEINDNLPESLQNELQNFIKCKTMNYNEVDKSIFNSIIPCQNFPFKQNSVKKINLMDSKNNYIINHSKHKHSKLTLSKLFEILYRHQKYIKYESFVFIGKIVLKNKIQKINNTNKKYHFYYNNQYELRARILKEQDNDIMEIILNDVSVLIRKEREKAIDQCRSMYLLKTAHEFMNPINSSMELINIMEDDIENQISKEEVLRYLKNLYFIMFNFLKDFTYFCEMKPLCEFCSITDFCKQCNKEDYCKRCQNCKTCKNNMIRDVNLKNLLSEMVDIFNNIVKFEGKNGVNFLLNYNIKELFIKFNPDYLKSIIFNIVYYFLKHSDSSTIEICICYDNTLKQVQPPKINKKSTKNTENLKTFGIDHNNKEKSNVTNQAAAIPAKTDDKIEISIKTNNILYEEEKLRFEKNKEILNNLEAYDNIEAIGFDEFNKSFQIYVGILLCNLSSSNLQLIKAQDSSIEYKFKGILAYNEEKCDIFTHLKSIEESSVNLKHISEIQKNVLQIKNSNNNLLDNANSKAINTVNIKGQNFENMYIKNSSRLTSNCNNYINNISSKLSECSDENSTNNDKYIFSNENIEYLITQENLITSNKINIINNSIFDKKQVSNKKSDSKLIKTINTNINVKNSMFKNLNMLILKSSRFHDSVSSPCFYDDVNENMKYGLNIKSSKYDLEKVSLNQSLMTVKAKRKNYLQVNSFRDENYFKKKNKNYSVSHDKYCFPILLSDLSNKTDHYKSDGLNIGTFKNDQRLSLKTRNNSFEKINNKKRSKSIINESMSTVMINDINLLFAYSGFNGNPRNIKENIRSESVNKNLDFNFPKITQEESRENITTKNYLSNNSRCFDKTKTINSNFLVNSQKQLTLRDTIDINITNNYHLDSQINNSNVNNKRINTLFAKKKIFRRILVVDDELLIRSILKRYFTKINISQQVIDYTVFEATNVFEAINIIYNMFQEKKYIDYIIIDEHMPFIKGSHMINLFKTIGDEKNFYRIKFISYTAFNTKSVKALIKEKGADYIINKPISYDEFIRLINEVEENLYNIY